jgi:hypothetical protein
VCFARFYWPYSPGFVLTSRAIVFLHEDVRGDAKDSPEPA